jgi:arginyl-tRNA synthetase
MKQTLTEILLQALRRAKEKGELKLETQPAITLDTPREKSHGDLATTLAMTLVKPEAKAPRKIAEIIVSNIQDEDGIIEKTEIAGPGFINFFLGVSAYHSVVREILEERQTFGHSKSGAGRKVQMEFVSANPTGPLHVGHGRGAVLGSTLVHGDGRDQGVAGRGFPTPLAVLFGRTTLLTRLFPRNRWSAVIDRRQSLCRAADPRPRKRPFPQRR